MANNRNEDILRAFGQNLKRLREEKGLTTRQLADQAEIAYSQIWTLESGKGDPSLTTIVALARGLGVEVKLLLTTKQ